MSEATETVKRWKDELSIYPSSAEIAKALNDHGEKAERTRKGKKYPYHRYPVLQKLAQQLFTNIKDKFNPQGQTTNVSRGKEKILNDILLQRKLIDVSEADPSLLPYAKDGKVFAIKDCPLLLGLDVCVENYQKLLELTTLQRQLERTCNDGLRLGCILLDPQYRQSVSGIMTKKLSRAKSDISGDPVLHFFEKIKDEAFCNEEYVISDEVKYYDEFPEEEKAKWDPNDPEVIVQPRTAHWLKETWETYVRKHYKAALDKWNKDTGGGDGSLSSFANFCGSYQWLVWIFILDSDTNFLLANNAGGRMPRHLTFEPGFEDISAITDGSPEGSSSALGKRIASAEDDLVEAKKHREGISSMLSLIKNKLTSSDNTDASRESTMKEKIEEVANYSRMMQDQTILYNMSPSTRDKYVKAIEKERQETLNKI